MNFLPPKPEFVKALEKNLENLQPPPFMRKAEKEEKDEKKEKEEEEESPEFLRDVPDEADKESLFPNINMPGIRDIPKPFRTFMKPVEKDKDINKDKEKEPAGFFPPSFPTFPNLPSFAPLLPFLQPKPRRVVEGLEGGDTNSLLSCGVLLMLVVCVLSVLFSVLDALKGLATGDMSGECGWVCGRGGRGRRVCIYGCVCTCTCMCMCVCLCVCLSLGVEERDWLFLPIYNILQLTSPTYFLLPPTLAHTPRHRSASGPQFPVQPAEPMLPAGLSTGGTQGMCI
jgi:hypothetical protein